MKRMTRDFLIISVIFYLASAVFYGIVARTNQNGIRTVFSNWDGPAYVVVAKSLYDPQIIHRLPKLPYIDTAGYYSQQFPVYPLFIRAFSFLGYETAMIAVTAVFGMLSIFALYALIRELDPGADAFMVSLFGIFYIPRWFINYHVGSSEPVFIFFLILTWYFFLKRNLWASAAAGACMMMTRPAGMFFAAGIALYAVLFDLRRIGRYLPYLLIPLALFGLYGFYAYRFGDFWIHVREYARHPIAVWPIFNNFLHPEGYYEIWKEGLLLLYLLYASAIVTIWKQKHWFILCSVLPYAVYLLFVYHPDISRYMLPLSPLLGIAYVRSVSQRRVAVPLLIGIPLVFMIAVGYVSYNTGGFF